MKHIPFHARQSSKHASSMAAVSLLAAEVAAAGLVDEYRMMVYPVLVGGGVPFFPRRQRRVALELLEHLSFNSGSSTSATALPAPTASRPRCVAALARAGH